MADDSRPGDRDGDAETATDSGGPDAEGSTRDAETDATVQHDGEAVEAAGDSPAVGNGDDGPGAVGDPAGQSGEAIDESGSAPGREGPCPECGEGLPGDARFCPACATALDEDGAVVDLSELSGELFPEGSPELLVETDQGLRRASGRVRALTGLAVSIPLAPLLLFLVGAVVPLTLPTGALVFVTGWICGAAVLSRARVPAEAFGRSLYLMAVGTLSIPVALAVGGVDSWSETLSLSFEVLAVASLALAAALVALGTFVTRQARKRVTGQRRGFENLRQD